MAVYYVATYGNDNNAGTSPSAPFRTINKAAQVMVDGDVCYVAPGVYREAVNVPSPASGTKKVTFVGDPEARKFPGVNPGEVRLDGSDDDVNPVRSVGVLVNTSVAVNWLQINVARFSGCGFELRTGNNVGPNVIERCRVSNVGEGVRLSTAGGTCVAARSLDINPCTIGVSHASGSCRSEIVDCYIFGDIGISASAVNSAVVASRYIFKASASAFNKRALSITGVGSTAYAEDITAVDCASAVLVGTAGVNVTIRRLSAIRCTDGIRSTLDVNTVSIDVKDSLFAECSYGVLGFFNNTVHVTRCAFPDVTTPTANVDSEVLRISTTTDNGGNVILRDFTNIGSQILRSEEQNPIEGLRSARIDVPRVAYYCFLVAVSGANTITLKAKKSHPTGTTVKFRVDEDPAKVVTLADTDQVQTVQLGPVEDRGPRFVPLEVWCQQVDFIDGHYVLIDSIQVI